MNSCSKTCAEPTTCTVRRARPWLGTFVEIRAIGQHSDHVGHAVNNAFTAVAQVHALMNAHDSTSELRRLAAAPLNQSYSVQPWTWQVLTAARQLAFFSDGAFDFTQCGRWHDLEILPENQVILQRRMPLNLSGIAKGFAVDVAIEALRSAGMYSGAVNAGGDLRVFGPECEPLHVRCPDNPGQFLSVGYLTNEAAATSGNYFDAKENARLRDPRTRQPVLDPGSITVRAPTCLFADGLTKVVAVLGLIRAQPLLAQYGATALILHPNGHTSTSKNIPYAA